MDCTISLLKDQKRGREQDQAIVELLSDFFASVVLVCQNNEFKLLRHYRKFIIEIFNYENFFEVSMLNLRHW